MSDIYKSFQTFAAENHLFVPHDRILLSLSAGKDSMALLHLMHYARESFDLELGIFHMNHMMRGGDSDDDAAFVRTLAARHKMPFFMECFDFPKDMPRGRSFEEFARELRYELLGKVARREGYNRIATGHSRDDQRETILMRIFQGTGLQGLGGIPLLRELLIRPLLFLSSEEIYAFLRQKQIPWREDGSNSDIRYLRNYIRHDLFPVIIKRFPNAGVAIDHLTDISRDTVILLDNLLDEKYGSQIRSLGEGLFLLPTCILTKDPRALTYILSRLFQAHNIFTRHSALKEIVRNLSARNRRDQRLLYENGDVRISDARVDGQWFFLWEKKKPNQEEGTILDDGNEEWTYRLNISELQESLYIHELNLKLQFQWIDYNEFKSHYGSKNFVFIVVDDNIGYIMVRNRRRGDRIAFGEGRKKLKKYFIEKKLDTVSKNRIPLIIVNDQIAAVLSAFTGAGESRVCEGFKVKSDDKKILAICMS